MEQSDPRPSTYGVLGRESPCWRCGSCNIDDKRSPLHTTAFVEAGATSIYIVHDVNDLDIDLAAMGVQIVVNGRYHKPFQTERAGVLHINPGSVGPRRFRLSVSIAKLDLEKRPWTAAFINLKI